MDLVPMFVGSWHVIWQALTTAPPLISQNWLAVVFGVVVFCMSEANNVRRHGWPTTRETWIKDIQWNFGMIVLAWMGLVILNSFQIVYQDHKNLRAERDGLRGQVNALSGRTSDNDIVSAVSEIARLEGALGSLFVRGRRPLTFVSTLRSNKFVDVENAMMIVFMDACNQAFGLNSCEWEKSDKSNVDIPQMPVSGLRIYGDFWRPAIGPVRAASLLPDLRGSIANSWFKTRISVGYSEEPLPEGIKRYRPRANMGIVWLVFE